MLRVLRQSRVLALTLLLAAPGLGGTWLSVAHPCPVDMPWLAQPSGHPEHAAQSAHGHSDAPASSTDPCHCVGACQGATAALITLAAAPAVTTAVAGWNTAPSSPDSDSPAQPRLRRHPPSTAPPLA
jgi:hypothetical protein